jgi:hypothetical protein
VLLLAGAFVAGNVVGDDSDEVDDLNDQVANLSNELSSSESDLEYVREELNLSDEQKRNLASQLKAEQDLSGNVDEIAGGSGSAPESDYLAGVAGPIAEYVMRPSVELESSSEDEARWVATIEAKNNGSEPAELFCGGNGVTLVDSDGRSYEGEAVLASDTANCGASLQPGLTIDNYENEFTLPIGAEPASIEISAGEFGEGPTKSWAVEAEA